MNRRLQGEVALLTGAGGDIGHCIAARCVREGASVLCVDIDLAGARPCAQAASEGGAAEGGAAEALECDVADARFAETAVDAALSLFGRLDILVNNAAVSSPYVPLHELDEQASFVTGTDLLVDGGYAAQ